MGVPWRYRQEPEDGHGRFRVAGMGQFLLRLPGRKNTRDKIRFSSIGANIVQAATKRRTGVLGDRQQRPSVRGCRQVPWWLARRSEAYLCHEFTENQQREHIGSKHRGRIWTQNS